MDPEEYENGHESDHEADEEMMFPPVPKDRLPPGTGSGFPSLPSEDEPVV